MLFLNYKNSKDREILCRIKGGNNMNSKRGIVNNKAPEPSNSILKIFSQEFKGVFADENPVTEDICQVFEWLKNEARNALSFTDLNIINYCRRHAEKNFSKSIESKKVVWKKSRGVSRELTHRFDELRTTKKVIKGRFAIFQGHKEEEKTLPPN